MRYFIDTEFIEDGRTIDLISIGIAAEDGRTYYAESSEFEEAHANPWVRANVLPQLSTQRISRAEMRQQILAFIGTDTPEFWGYYADYDWVALCQLFGTMMDLPPGWPMYCHDLQQLIDQFGLTIKQSEADAHHALADAKWVRAAWQMAEAKIYAIP